ncbi:hypothetical protein C8R44DRAFT_671214 [Mycena epipterygia]|nr:hypothetical protein C8R44DRAFT_671214 [Mycena epipterygia]
MDDEATGLNLRRANDLWFSNDTLVLQAEDMVFRVSKSILTARSSVFRDMTAFPQSATGGEETIEGSPVVRLHDSAADVEVFLRAIFDSSYFMPRPEKVDIHVVLGIVRLAHKYDVEYLFRRGLQHLASTYPSQLDDYASPEAPSTAVHLKVIKVATEVGTQWILPAAYYWACDKGVADILDNGGVPWTELSSDQQRKCLISNTFLVGGMLSVHQCFRRDNNPADCTNLELCRDNRQRLHEFVLSKVGGGLISVLTPWAESAWSWQPICRQCIVHGKDTYQTARAAFWEALPANFGLPAWDDLENMKVAVMGE